MRTKVFASTALILVAFAGCGGDDSDGGYKNSGGYAGRTGGSAGVAGGSLGGGGGATGGAAGDGGGGLPQQATLKRSSRSSSIAVSDDDKRVVMVNPEDGSISAFDAESQALTSRTKVGAE